jgi:type II secretion system protein D
MNSSLRPHRPAASGLRRTAGLCFLSGLLLTLAIPAPAQVIRRFIPGGSPQPGVMMPDNPPPGAPSGGDSGPKNAGNGPWVPSDAPARAGSGTNTTMNATNEIQISFQGANVDMVAQWLAQTTGKAVVKHPRVQCQLTIISSQKVSPREAVNMVYRALALEGFSAIESGKSILIVPEGSEPKMSPELVEGSLTNIPEGRQRLVKVFSLNHIQAVEVKERVRTALSEKATLDVDEHANRIVITDYNDNIRVAGELIDALDTDRPEDVAVRIIPLKHIAADQLAKEMAPLYQKLTGKSGSGNQSTIDVAADDRSNSLIVLSSQSAFGAIQKLVATLDTEEAQEKATHTFILKNADAQDVAKQLQELNQNQSQSTARYAYFYSSPSESNSRKLSVVADRRRNAVIVQAPPAQMNNVEKMIQELDEPIADGSLAPKIYPLKYVSATDMEDVLNELFLKKQQQRSYWDMYYGDSDSSDSSGQDAGRLYGKVRITSEPYANAIIVTSNSKENLAVVEDVLNQLDRPSEAGESTLRVGLKFAKSETVARNLNILFAKNGSPALRSNGQQPQPNANNNNNPAAGGPNSTSQTGFDLTQEASEDGYYPWLGGQPDNTRGSDGKTSTRAVSDLVGRVRTVADNRGNALVISANVHFFPQILKLIEDLDSPTDQVSIEARIVEVSSDFLDKLGVRWSPDGSKVFTADDYENSLLASSSGNYRTGLGNNTSVNTPNSPSADVVQTLASLRSGVVGSTINIDYLVQFMRKTTDATVLGEPSITIDNNETAKLFVGQQIPTPESTQVSTAGSKDTSFKYKDVGVVLEVTPHINRTGDVQLKIHVESSSVVAGETILGGAVFDTRNFRTEVTAQNDQTLIIGGIIQKQVSDVLRKTPILGDIPGLGWAFKKKDKESREVELMVFLRPRIIHSVDDAKKLLEETRQKTTLLKRLDPDATPDKGKKKK